MAKDGGVKKLPFDNTTESEASVPDTQDISAARNFDPEFGVLDAATRSESLMARDDNERRLNSQYAAGVPLSYRLKQASDFAAKLAAQRGFALAQGEEARNRLKLSQKLALAGLTKGVKTRERSYGYTSGLKGSNGAAAAGIGAAGSIISSAILGAALSDKELKTNIRPHRNVLDRLDGYRTVAWDWKETGEPDAGVIAQEVDKTFPEAVAPGDARQGLPWLVDYGKLGAFALEGVKELNEKVDKLAKKASLSERLKAASNR